MLIFKKTPSFFNTILIALLIALTSTLNCPSVGAESNAAAWQKFAGTWEGANDYAVMRLAFNVDTANKNIYGSHKAIGENGKMVDMVSDDTLSINGFFLNDTTAEVSYVSGYNPTDRGTGTARITMIDDNTIKWQTTYRDGISYIPPEIELKKISPTAATAKHVLFKNAWSVFDTKTKKQFALKSPVKSVTDSVGAPQSKTLFLGSGVHSGEIYYYDGLEILAEKAADGYMAAYIYINNDRFVTPGNLKVGDSAEKMITLYGAIEKNKRVKEGRIEWYTYIIDTKNNFKSSFAVEDGIITSIRFSTPIGWSDGRSKGWSIGSGGLSKQVN